MVGEMRCGGMTLSRSFDGDLIGESSLRVYEGGDGDGAKDEADEGGSAEM